jgi:hypothetical protein
MKWGGFGRVAEYEKTPVMKTVDHRTGKLIELE